MPPSDRLDVLNTEDIANDFLLQNEVSQQHVMRRVPQDMTYPKHSLFSLSLALTPCILLPSVLQRPVNIQAALQPRAQRLLNANMHAHARNATHNLLMHLI